MKLSLVAFVFLLLVFQYIETKAQSASSCWEKSNPCVCEYEDSSTGINMTVDISNYFKYPSNPESDEPNKYTYLFSPCSETSCKTTKTKGVACQYIITQERSVSLGRIDDSNTWFINKPSASEFQFTINYKNGDPDSKNKSRTAKVIFIYEDTDMKMNVTSEQDSAYVMQVTGRLVQPHGGKSGGGGGGKGGGGTAPGIIGIVIMILALGGIITYFVVGGIYMYRVKGARGVEMIPNYTFWKEIPFLIKDGFFFTISPCYKRQGEYEKL